MKSYIIYGNKTNSNSDDELSVSGKFQFRREPVADSEQRAEPRGAPQREKYAQLRDGTKMPF